MAYLRWVMPDGVDIFKPGDIIRLFLSDCDSLGDRDAYITPRDKHKLQMNYWNE